MPTREDMKILAQEIIGAHEARVEGIKQIRGGTQGQLRQLREVRQSMARQLRADLARGHSNLASSVASQLRQLDATHQSMARQLRADLAQGRATLTQAEARRSSEVKAWMRDIVAAHMAAQQEWQHLTATMLAKRTGRVAVMEAPTPAAETGSPSFVAGATEEEEDVFARAEVGEVTSEFASLSDRVFQYLANHPDGTRLTELEQEFGMNRLDAARVVRNLMDAGKAEKRALFYFAI